ncbi:Uncharacterized protein {ECO:0000313/EMBL:CCF10576.1} [Pantoea ananatis]|nr:hypothetical protein PANA5342_3183 [Pantoea ananatis LMG 5342]CRH37396.1 Uncharacterized protein {ECO:0000313/EMBL:CCF10576.1} [Pantoea ananatis]
MKNGSDIFSCRFDPIRNTPLHIANLKTGVQFYPFRRASRLNG